MAYGQIPEDVYCEGDCKHTDCIATRKMLACKCSFCGEPIAYRRFYRREGQDSPYVLDHVSCVEQAYEGSINK